MHVKRLATLGIVVMNVIVGEHVSFDGAELFFILNHDHSPACAKVQ